MSTKMGDDLPSKFDLIVVGTGFSESIVAAAASRIGKQVLHIDPNEFYGGPWASFNLDAFQKFITDCTERIESSRNCSPKANANNCALLAAEQQWYIPDKLLKDGINQPNWTKVQVEQDFRKFNIDLTAKLLFSAGSLVQLLISSNICRYAEFRAVDKICTKYEREILNVPCSRKDVFNSKDLTIVEKRLLMKFLARCMSYEEHPDEFKDFESKTFYEYLKTNNLTDKVIHCVLYSISMSDESTIFQKGMERTKKFLHSIGRYGNTPFLFPMYGCGEIPQCFCRLCAVFGGIYCLKKTIDNIHNQNEEFVIEFDNQEIKANHLLIGSHENIPQDLIKQQEKAMDETCCSLSRGVFITSSPIGNEELNDGGGGVNFLRLPDSNDSGAFVIQLSHYSGTCPKNLYLIHITTKKLSDNPKVDISPYASQLFDETNNQPPKVLYSAYFQLPKCNGCTISLPEAIRNLHLACGPFFELDYDLSIKNAKDIFSKMYPNEIFLPRAPDPEEIIIGDEDPSALLTSQLAEDLLEQITELDGTENQVKCIDQNEQNEEKDK